MPPLASSLMREKCISRERFSTAGGSREYAPELAELALVVDAEHLFLSETYEWWILAKENVAG